VFLPFEKKEQNLDSTAFIEVQQEKEKEEKAVVIS